MGAGGAVLKFGSTFLRALEFGASAVALGIFSYFLAVLADHNKPIYNRWRAVEGISGAACLYTLFGVILTCCLGGISFFGFIAVVLDVLFAGAFAAVTYYTRHGAGSCRGIVNTPLGIGQSNRNSEGYGQNGFGFDNGENVTYFPDLHYACRLNTVVFAVSIINIFLFLVTAAVQIGLIKKHQADKKYGPSPSNNYTTGRGGKFAFWKRNKVHHSTRDAEAATALPHHRVSGETGTTIGNGHHTAEPKFGQPGYGQATNY